MKALEPYECSRVNGGSDEIQPPLEDIFAIEWVLACEWNRFPRYTYK